MKTGLQIGAQAEVCVQVTAEMRPQFGGQIVHDVYATASMVYHMEHAARKTLLPYLEAHEEGMGLSVSVTHLAPAPVGAIVRAVATVTDFSPHKIVTDVEVWSKSVQIGRGIVVQAVLPKTKIEERIGQMVLQMGHEQ